MDCEKIIDAIWNDPELIEAIEWYGEWNHTEMNKTFEKVKAKHLRGV